MKYLLSMPITITWYIYIFIYCIIIYSNTYRFQLNCDILFFAGLYLFIYSTGGNEMHRDCIAFAIYSDSWATMDTASGPGVRGTFFKAIPQSIKIINLLFIYWTSINYIIVGAKSVRELFGTYFWKSNRSLTVFAVQLIICSEDCTL